jgi:hypothetical protein
MSAHVRIAVIAVCLWRFHLSAAAPWHKRATVKTSPVDSSVARRETVHPYSARAKAALGQLSREGHHRYVVVFPLHHFSAWSDPMVHDTGPMLSRLTSACYSGPLDLESLNR